MIRSGVRVPRDPRPQKQELFNYTYRHSHTIAKLRQEKRQPITMKKNKNINIRRIFQISAILSLIIIYLIQWNRIISTPSLRTGADFIAFFAGGRIAQENGFSSAYNIPAQHRIEETLIGFSLTEKQVLLYNHVPYLLPLLKLLVNADYIGSFIRWLILMLCIYAAGSLIFLNEIFKGGKNEANSILIISTLTFFPFIYSLFIGQDTAMLFLGVSLWCVGILKKQDWLAAAGLALTTVRPHLCLTLAIPFCFRYRKVWWRFMIIAGLLTLTSIFLLEQKGTLDYINILRISANGNWYGMNESSMLNLIGLIWRIYPLTDPRIIHSISWFGYLTGIGLVSFLWVKSRELDGRLLGASIIIALLFAPHLHFHDLALLIIPLIFAIRIPIPNISPQQISLLPLIISLVFLFEPMRYILPYGLYAALFWWLIKINPKQTQVHG